MECEIQGPIMDQREFTNKYSDLKILKSIQEYLKSDENKYTAVYPIRIPDELLYQTLKLKGAKDADKMIHHIFKLGLSIWSEKIYYKTFGSQQNLEEFIKIIKEHKNRDK